MASLRNSNVSGWTASCDQPFLISCFPYTGGGFLGIFTAGKHTTGFDASFEFGSASALRVGPLM
jgi:hypothetical protein